MNKYYSSIAIIVLIGAGAFLLMSMNINDEKKYIIKRLLKEQGLVDNDENRCKFSGKSVDELRRLIKK